MTEEPKDLASVLGRLRALLNKPPLTVSIEGGGVPDRKSIYNAQVFIIERYEVENVIALLEGVP